MWVRETELVRETVRRSLVWLVSVYTAREDLLAVEKLRVSVQGRMVVGLDERQVSTASLQTLNALLGVQASEMIGKIRISRGKIASKKCRFRGLRSFAIANGISFDKSARHDPSLFFSCTRRSGSSFLLLAALLLHSPTAMCRAIRNNVPVATGPGHSPLVRTTQRNAGSSSHTSTTH
ncbi:hypothetical protein BDZ91DRAFT_755185 [Kalaharituber pfeilii]|nr:hypothetical protein BDZ91DRAFT_755185 [Kalaharituber pfeilii]